MIFIGFIYLIADIFIAYWIIWNPSLPFACKRRKYSFSFSSLITRLSAHNRAIFSKNWPLFHNSMRKALFEQFISTNTFSLDEENWSQSSTSPSGAETLLLTCKAFMPAVEKRAVASGDCIESPSCGAGATLAGAGVAEVCSTSPTVSYTHLTLPTSI